MTYTRTADAKLIQLDATAAITADQLAAAAAGSGSGVAATVDVGGARSKRKAGKGAGGTKRSRA